jgi:hypothetical protein
MGMRSRKGKRGKGKGYDEIAPEEKQKNEM